MSKKDAATPKSSKDDTVKKRAVTRSSQPAVSDLQAAQQAASDPRAMRPADILAVQRKLGNQAARYLLDTRTIQAKLTVGAAHDEYEQEADRVAAQVMSSSAPAPNVQRLADEEEEIQTKPLAAAITPLAQRAVEEDEEELQAKPASQSVGRAGGLAPDDVVDALGQTRGGQPLAHNLRADFEPKFGADFGGVRVHTDDQADALNRSLNARAFTIGNDIFFGRGEYSPTSSASQELIAHELTHTVQQGAAPIQSGNTDAHTTQLQGAARIQRGKKKGTPSAPKPKTTDPKPEKVEAPTKPSASDLKDKLTEKIDSFSEQLSEAKDIVALKKQESAAEDLRELLDEIDILGAAIQERLTEVSGELEDAELEEMEKLVEEEDALRTLNRNFLKQQPELDGNLTEFEGEIALKKAAASASVELTRLRGLWTSPASALGHFNKHTGDTGYGTEVDYLQAAEALTKSKASSDILTKTRGDGDQLFFKRSTGEFSILSAGGKIRTLFCPSGGETYYNNQS